MNRRRLQNLLRNAFGSRRRRPQPKVSFRLAGPEWLETRNVLSVSLDLGSPTFSETGTDTVTATLSAPLGNDVVVALGFSGTATEGTNYSASSNTITIPAGQTSNVITLTGIDDGVYEGDQSIVASISGVTGDTAGTPNQVTATMTDAESPPTVALTQSATHFAEAGGTDTLTATLSAAAGVDVSVGVSFVGSTAVEGTNYALPATPPGSSGTIVIPAGQMTGTLTLTGIDDGKYDGSTPLTVVSKLGTITNGTADTSHEQVSATIDDAESPPTVALSISGSPMAENGGQSVVQASLSAMAAVDVTVNLTFGGSAVEGTNYSVNNSAITIPAGSLSGSITITAKDDGEYDANQDVVTTIQSVTNGTADSSHQSVTANFVDDQSEPTVALSLSPQGSTPTTGSFNEKNGTIAVVATLSGPASVPVTVPLNFGGTATEGSNYGANSTTITIPAGQTSSSITLTGMDDGKYDGDTPMSVTVGMGTITNATPDPNSANDSVVATINDAETAPTVALSLSSSTFQEAGGTVAIIATLSQPAAVDVTIGLSFVDSTAVVNENYDLPASPPGSNGSIVIPAGSTTGTLVLTGVDDGKYDGSPGLTVKATLGNITNATADISHNTVTATIVDAESPPVVTLSVDNTSIDENGGTATLTAALSAMANAPVTVALSYTGTANRGVNYSYSSSITIPAGSLSGTTTVSGIDDHEYDGATPLTIDVAMGTVTNGTSGSPSSVAITMQDAESAPTVSLGFSPTSIPEVGGSTTLTATLSAAEAATVTVNVAFSGTATAGTDYTSPASTVITIPAGSTTGSLTVSTLDAQQTSGSKSLIATISGATNATVLGTVQATATINDSEPAVNLSLSSATLNENAGTTTLVASIATAVSVPITVKLNFSGSATQGTDYTASATSITIPAGQVSGNITLTAIDESLASGTKTITASIASVSPGVAGTTTSVTATIQDNDTSSSTPAAPTGLTLSSSSSTSGLTNYTTSDTPTFTMTAATGLTVQLLVNGTVVGTATEGTPGNYTITLPAGKLAVGTNSITTQAVSGSNTSAASSAVSLMYAPGFTQLYTVPGAIGASETLTFNFTSRSAVYRSELGMYVVSDSSGSVGGVAPGSSGYAQAALSSSNTQILFAPGDDPGATKTVTLTGGELIAFYLVQNSTSASFLSQNPGDSHGGGPVAFFSYDAANPDGTRHELTSGDPTTGNIQIGWEDLWGGGDRDYNDLVLSIVPSAATGQSGAAVRAPGSSSDSISASFSLDAGNVSFSSLAGDVGIFYVTDPSGAVNGIAPGAAGYAAAALASGNSQILFTAGSAAGAIKTVTIPGNTLFGFYTISSGSTANFLSANSANASGGGPVAFFTFDSANADNENHFRWFDPEKISQPSLSLNSATDPQVLHVMDQLFGGESDFDAFKVSMQL